MYKILNSFLFSNTQQYNLPMHCYKCEGKNLSDISSYLLKLNQRYSDKRECKNTGTHISIKQKKHFGYFKSLCKDK